MEPAWRKKQLFCYQLLWVGPLVANTIWRHDEGFHLSISDSAQHVGMHRLLLQAQSSFLDGNHKKCEIICQLYIFFWSLPVVDQEKNLNILLYSDLNVPGELRWWLILYWPLVSDMLVVVSYYGSQPLNQACNLLIDSPCKSLLQSSSSNSWHYTNKEPLHAVDLKSHTWQCTGYHSSIGEPASKLVAQDSKDSSDVHGFKDHQIKELITDY